MSMAFLSLTESGGGQPAFFLEEVLVFAPFPFEVVAEANPSPVVFFAARLGAVFVAIEVPPCELERVTSCIEKYR